MLRRINQKCGFAIDIAIRWGSFVTKETCQYPGHAGVRKCIQDRYVIPYICVRTFKSCLELLYQWDQVVFSNIFCYHIFFAS